MKTIAISSFKGGTAKTSSTLHLGAALAKYHKKKVLLIDMDAQANLTMGLGYDPDELDSLAPVLQGTKPIQEVVQKTPIKNLDIIPADTWLERVEVTGPLASDRYSHERLKKVLKNVSYDYVFIDTPPSLCWLTESALIACDHSMICATCEFYSIKGLERLSEFMSTISQRHSMQVLGVIISFWNSRGKNNTGFLEVIDRTFPSKCFDAKVRRDIQVSSASLHGLPLFEIPKFAKESRAAEDYRKLAKEVLKRLKDTK